MAEVSAETKVSMVLQELAQGLDENLEREAGQKMGFCLFVFNSVPGAPTSYISNCEREFVQKGIKELFDQWQAGMPDIPAHLMN